MRTQSQLIELLIKALPYPDQIKELDLTREASAIRFTWRGNKFKVTETLDVDEVENGCLTGSDKAILLRQAETLGALS